MGKKAGLAIGVGLGAGLVAAGVGKGLFDLGAKFDEQFDKIRVGSGKTGAALDALEDDFRGVLKNTPASFEDVGTAITDLNRRLGLTGKPLRTFATQMVNLSRITKTDLSTNIEKVAKAFEDWEVPVGGQTKALDGLFRLGQRSGASVATLASQVQKFGSPLRILGFSLGEAAATFATFERAGVNIQTTVPGLKLAISNLTRPSANLAKAMDALGISATSPEKGLKQVFKLLGKQSDLSNIDKRSLAMDVFGKRAGADMAEAIRQGRFEVGEMMKVFGKGDTINKAARDTEDFNESWRRLKNKVFVGLEPIASKVFDTIGDGMERLATADFGKIGKNLGGLDQKLGVGNIDFGDIDLGSTGKDLNKLKGSAIAFGKAMNAVFGPIIKTLLPGLVQGFKGSLQVVGGVLKTLAALLHGDFSGAFDGLKLIFEGVGNTLVGTLRAATAPIQVAAKALAGALVDPIKDAVGGVGDGVTAAFDAVKNAIVGASTAVLTTVKDVWGRIRKALLIALAPFALPFVVPVLASLRGMQLAFKALTAVVGIAGKAFRGLTDALKTALAPLAALAKRTFDGIVRIVRAVAGPIRDAGRAIGRSVLNPIKSALDSVAGVFRSGMQAALGVLRSQVGKAADLGERIGGAVVRGLKSALRGAGKVIVGGLSFAGDFAKAIGQKIADVLNDAIPNKIGPINLPDNPIKLARGGTVQTDTLALVGEEGPELAKFAGKTTLIGQAGPEVLNLPVGTRVYSHPETKRKLAPVIQKVSRVLDGKALPGVEGVEQSQGQGLSRGLGGRRIAQVAERLGIQAFARGGAVRRLYKPRRKAPVFKHREPSRKESARGDRIARQQERIRNIPAQPRLFKPRAIAPVFQHHEPSAKEKRRGDRIAARQEKRRAVRRKRRREQFEGAEGFVDAGTKRSGLRQPKKFPGAIGRTLRDAVTGRGVQVGPVKLFDKSKQPKAYQRALRNPAIETLMQAGGLGVVKAKALQTLMKNPRYAKLLTEEQRQAILSYQGNEGGELAYGLNRALRRGKTLDRGQKVGMGHLDAAFVKTLPEDKTLWRGVSPGGAGARQFDSLKDGDVFIDPAFGSVSTSVGEATAYGKAGFHDPRQWEGIRRYKILGKKGTPYIGTGNISREVLLQRGARYKVVGRKRIKATRRAPAGGTEVHLQMLPARKTGGIGDSKRQQAKGRTAGGLQPAARYLASTMKQKFGLSVSPQGGVRPGDTGSFHSVGKAVDLVGSKMREGAEWVKTSGLYKTLLEGIHNPNLSADSGKLVSPGFWGGSTWAGHRDHVHLAADSIRQTVKQNLDQKGGAKKRSTRITGGSLSLGQMVTLSKKVGFPDPALAAAVGYAESRGKVGAVGDGGDSLGLFQINTPAHPKYDKDKLQHDAFYNARAALSISKKGKDFGPWTQFRNGAYKQFKNAKGKPLPKGTTKGTPTGSKYTDYLAMRLLDAESDTPSDPRDDIRWINRALRYWRGVRKRNLAVGNWSRATEAKQSIIDLREKKKTLREETEDPNLFTLGELTEIGTGPNAFKIGGMQTTLDNISLEKANASLTVPPDTDDSIGALKASLQDDIAAENRLVGFWQGLKTLADGFLQPFATPLDFKPTKDQSKQLSRTKNQAERIALLKQFMADPRAPNKGTWIQGTIAQKIEATNELGTAKSQLRDLLAEINKTDETEAITGANAKTEQRAFLAALGDLTKNFGSNFRPLQSFGDGGIIQGPKGRKVVIEGHGGEAVINEDGNLVVTIDPKQLEKMVGQQQVVKNIDARMTFANVPADPHIWSRNVKHELEAA